ncbi:chemotaxis protein MotB [Rhodopseudomonas rhenobacensis]|uniref:Chemotaxis protein MotB n=1 Tax=Rhodopseudomonas rhenobacensis TaxID=87461 RepID=A0A7W8DXW7_9BRAD|nr:flagellar motor protein MotB [Rhodopseudomonas rhenobacensis]MBB5046323.1 chemotaxis protein MotB [Rhodopseudomonas rhenobacensis]
MALGRAGGNKKKPEEAGGHVGAWFVTFADLMGLLTGFFVMLVSFSHQDQYKMQIVAGSMREAFGVQTDARWSGVIESDGVPTRGKVKNVEHLAPDQATNTPSPDEGGGMAKVGRQLKADREFALASASLRQALQDMPEITEISKNVMFEETPQGLNLQIVDQEGRPMFPDGSPLPYERTIALVRKLAAPLRATALRVSIVGHTSSAVTPGRDDDDAFVLSWQRANAVRQLLKREGLPSSHVFAVAGKADSEPLFPDAPLLAANRRVTITLMRESPPMPPDLQP